MKYLIKEIYTTYNTFNPEILVEFLNIDLRYVDYINNPKGQYIKIRDRKIILIKDTLEFSNERFFIIAHELYHALNHTDLIGYYSISKKTKNKMECEANHFAVKLLYEHFIHEHESLPYSFQELMYNYGIPQNFDYFL